jgi:hypothetical protein
VIRVFRGPSRARNPYTPTFRDRPCLSVATPRRYRTEYRCAEYEYHCAEYEYEYDPIPFRAIRVFRGPTLARHLILFPSVTIRVIPWRYPHAISSSLPWCGQRLRRGPCATVGTEHFLVAAGFSYATTRKQYTVAASNNPRHNDCQRYVF